VCKGEDDYVRAGQVVSTNGDTASLTIEWNATKDNSEAVVGTASVGGFGEGSVFAPPGHNEVSILGGDVHSKSGLWIGILDRVTGSFHVSPGPATPDAAMLRDGKYFVGTCQPGKKLF